METTNPVRRLAAGRAFFCDLAGRGQAWIAGACSSGLYGQLDNSDVIGFPLARPSSFFVADVRCVTGPACEATRYFYWPATPASRGAGPAQQIRCQGDTPSVDNEQLSS
jgi:hypothetical protein